MFTKKKVSRTEYEFALLASEYGIHPKIYSYKDRIMTMERLDDYPTIEDEQLVYDKIKELHNIGIFHGDMHAQNMMKKNGRIYLIDFERSTWIKDIDDEYIKDFLSCHDMEDTNFLTDPHEIQIKKLLHFEATDWNF